MTIMTIIMMIMKVNISKHMKKSVQVKVVQVCLKRKNVQKATFSWSAKVTEFKYQKQSTKIEKKN